jgi:hypothetical protein
LAEGAEPTLALLCDASGLTPEALAKRMARQGWRIAPAKRDGLRERLQGIAGTLVAKVEAIGARLADGEGPDKAELDGLVALIRALEKIDDMQRPEEAAEENNAQNDEDLAAMLDAVNARIVALAEELADSFREARGEPTVGSQ